MFTLWQCIIYQKSLRNEKNYINNNNPTISRSLSKLCSKCTRTRFKELYIIEPNTNTVIAEFNSSDLIEPASMTKVMTGYVVSDQIKNELISLNDQVLISEKAWKMEGSKMFIEVGKKVSILDLLKGIIIQSGNDASVAIAEYVGEQKMVLSIS